ncbi:hypothetical protein Pelo_5097 [Pelomyxa schiedti]|nr:hypothetical protein Pelo_5097 [Pelomyxa schiedti]
MVTTIVPGVLHVCSAADAAALSDKSAASSSHLSSSRLRFLALFGTVGCAGTGTSANPNLSLNSVSVSGSSSTSSSPTIHRVVLVDTHNYGPQSSPVPRRNLEEVPKWSSSSVRLVENDVNFTQGESITTSSSSSAATHRLNHRGDDKWRPHTGTWGRELYRPEQKQNISIGTTRNQSPTLFQQQQQESVIIPLALPALSSPTRFTSAPSLNLPSALNQECAAMRCGIKPRATDLWDVLPECFDFIDGNSNSSGATEGKRDIDDRLASTARGTVVYCESGRNQCIVVALAYLVVVCKYTLRDSAYFMNDRIPFSYPSIEYLFQLLEIEKSFHGAQSLSLVQLVSIFDNPKRLSQSNSPPLNRTNPQFPSVPRDQTPTSVIQQGQEVFGRPSPPHSPTPNWCSPPSSARAPVPTLGSDEDTTGKTVGHNAALSNTVFCGIRPFWNSNQESSDSRKSPLFPTIPNPITTTRPRKVHNRLHAFTAF